MATGGRGASSTRRSVSARSARVALAFSASTLLTAVVAVPMGYQAHAARSDAGATTSTTEVPPSVLGTSTVSTTADTDPAPTTTITPTTTTTVAPGEGAPDEGAVAPDASAATARATPGVDATTTTTAPWFALPERPSPTTTAPDAPAPATPPTTSAPAPTPGPDGLFVSTSFLLVPAVPLQGAQVATAAFVFLELPEVAEVQFFLDGVASAREFFAPWELFGGVALTPTQLKPGQHTVRADITFSDGRNETRSAVFTVIVETAGR